MQSLRKLGFPLVAAVAALVLSPLVAKADNPITKPYWQMPRANTADKYTGSAVDCDPQAVDALTGLRFGNCFNQNTLLLRMTGGVNPAAHPTNSLMDFAQQVVANKLLRANDSGGNATTLFTNFIDLTLKRFLDDNTATTIDYNQNTYLYRPVTAPGNLTGPFSGPDSIIGSGGYEAAALLDKTCLDVPLVGTVCLNGYLYDVNNEVGQKFFEYSVAAGEEPIFQLVPQVNLDVESEAMNAFGNCADAAICGDKVEGTSTLLEAHRDDDDGLQVRLVLNKVKLDLLFEPPGTDTTLTDVKNDSSSASYLPERDLSTYLKAYGQAELGQVELILALRVASNYNDSIQPHTVAIGFELQNVSFNGDFQFQFNKGPYCNNNLATVDDPRYNPSTLANGLDVPEADRAFPLNGAGAYANGANYPDLVSDWTVGYTNARLGYFALDTGAYPHAGPEMAGTAVYPAADPYRGGGSGVGRDRIGVGTSPYEYNPTDGRYSDNPNNCRRPADACTGGSGLTVQQGGPEWGQVSNSCEYPNVSNNSDDATFKISEQITAIIPYIQGEIKVTAEDKFKNRERGNPGYYLGPTSLLDLGATLAGLSFDWPLRPGTDYVFIDAILQSDVDNDGTNEFWADEWGVLMPFDFAVGVSWNTVPGITAPTDKRLDLGACVQELGVVTGYRDGFGEFQQTAENAGPYVARTVAQSATQNMSDDPFLTLTYAPKMVRNPVGGVDSLRGLLTGFGFPAVTTPFIAPAAGDVTPTTGSYALGFAVHQNVLSGALYDAVVKGLLCADLDATGQYAPVDDQLGGTTVADLLNTATFEMFFPKLYEQYPERPMRVRVIPLLNKYVHRAACPGGPGAGGTCTGTDPYTPGDGIYEVESQINNLPHLVPAEVPYVIMGGPPIGFNMVIGAGTNANPEGLYMYPDLTLVIPNLLIEFYVYGDKSGSNNWYRVFAVDMGVAIGLNIDIVKTPSTFVNLPTPPMGLTYFPVGCNPSAPSGSPAFCSGGSAQTKRVLRLAGLADPEINAIIEYSELTFGQDGTAGTTSSVLAGVGSICEGLEPGDPACAGTEHAVENAFTDPNVLRGAISNLIGMALSLDASALMEIGFDLGAFLNIPMAIDAPYIGPSYVQATGGPVTNATDLETPNPNGFGDYLVGGVSLDLTALSSSYLIRQIDYLLDDTDSTAPFGLSDLNIGLAPARLPANYIPVPQATVEAPIKVSATETVFRFSGYDAHDGESVRFSWRVDNGVWSVFSPATEARINGLLEGKHTFEVKAINSQNMMQDVPARYTFVVDSIAPKIRVVGDRTVSRRASFFVEANDWLTPKEDIRVAYQLDDGRWSNYGYNKKISLSGLREGRHTLRVRASDNAGNAAESAFNFSASSGGFGCSTAAGSGSLADVLVMLVIPALVFLRRRMF